MSESGNGDNLEQTAWGHEADPVDWAGTVRLALVVSIVAALFALALVSVLPETAIVVAIIVAGTAASWYQLERRPATR